MQTKESSWRRGWVVFGGLVVLTAVEFGVSTALQNPLLWLTIIALIKAGAIMIYFMRLGDMRAVWQEEEQL